MLTRILISSRDEEELGTIASRHQVSSIISLNDPELDLPAFVEAFEGPKLVLRFHDLTDPDLPDVVSPEDVRCIISFAHEPQAHDDYTLIHCTAGISRSPAAALILAAARHPDEELSTIVLNLLKENPWMLPNPLMLKYAENLLRVPLRAHVATTLHAHAKDHRRDWWVHAL